MLRLTSKFITLVFSLSLCISPLSAQAFSLSDFFDFLSGEDATKPSSTTMNQFRKEYKLVFVFSSECGYCHKFAPVLKSFANQKNISLESLTANGGKVSGFSDARFDRARIDELGIQSFPAVIAEKKNDKNDYYYLASGNMPRERLEENLYKLINYIY